MILYKFDSPVTSLHYVSAKLTTLNTKRQKAGKRVGEQPLSGSNSPQITQNENFPPLSTYIYATSENKVVVIALGKKDEAVRTVRSPCFSLDPNCSYFYSPLVI